ncbi:MAG TPA: hypothetical protein VF627_00345, partial [Abditibacterium sp.]
MKKRLWLLFLPILLFGGVFWAKQAAWNRMEADFRSTFIQEAIQVSGGSSVGLTRHDLTGGYPKSFGQWKNKELEMALADVHLMRSPPPQQFSEKVPEYFICYGSEMSNYFGIFLEVGEDKGAFNFASPQNYEKWQGLELTPKSCRVLKKRI